MIRKRQLYQIPVLLAICMPPYLYTHFRVFSWAMAICQYALLAHMVLIAIKTKCKAYSPVFGLLLLGSVVEYTASLLNPAAAPMIYLETMLKTIGVRAYYDRMFRKESVLFLETYGMILLVFSVINLATIILFPNGMYTIGSYTHCYFLGYDNTHINYQLPLLCAFAILRKRSKRHARLFDLSVLVVVVSLALTLSITSIIGVLVFLIGMFVIDSGKKTGKLKSILIVRPIISFAVFGAVTVGLVSGSLLIRFKGIIQNVFNKEMTLNARTLIWTNALLGIRNKPILGYGYETTEVVNKQLVNIEGQTGWGGSAHNTYLSVLFTGGIVLMAVVIVLFLLIDKRIGNSGERTCRIMELMIFVVLLMGLVENHYDNLLFTTLLMAYNLKAPRGGVKWIRNNASSI